VPVISCVSCQELLGQASGCLEFSTAARQDSFVVPLLRNTLTRSECLRRVRLPGGDFVSLAVPAASAVQSSCSELCVLRPLAQLPAFVPSVCT